jgi:hypothetical protein
MGEVSASGLLKIERRLADLWEAHMGWRPASVEVRADNDNLCIIYTLTDADHGLRIERTWAYSLLDAKPPKPKKRERNPAPEVVTKATK